MSLRGGAQIALAGVTVALWLVASCASPTGQPPGAPPVPPPSGMLPPSPGASLAPAVTDGPSTPSPHADPELEALLPAEVRGIPLTKSSVAASSLVGTPAEASLTKLAQRVGRPLDDITLAAAVDPTGRLAGGVNAMRLRGGSGAELLAAIAAIEQDQVPTEIGQEMVGGRNVTRLTQREGDATITRFLYATGEVVYVVLSPDQPTAASFIERLP